MLVYNKGHAHSLPESSQGSPPKPILHKSSKLQFWIHKTTVLGQNLHPEGQANSLPAPDFISSKAYPVFRPDPTFTWALACCLHIRHRTNKGGPSAAILLQQYKEWEIKTVFLTPLQTHQFYRHVLQWRLLRWNLGHLKEQL